MNVKRFWALAILLLSGLTLACADELQIIVLYDQSQGLKPGDLVYMDEKSIGSVSTLEVNPDGRFAAHIRIDQDDRQMVTDQCRFYIKPDPQGSGHQSIQIVKCTEGAKPLSPGATIEGSSYLSDLLEQGGRERQDWSERLREEIERWAKGLSELPEKEWYRQLERQIEQWSEELAHADENVR
jgi:hypothetical protein